MLPLAIWLFLIGYTIAITGKRNLGLSYQPQSDGSIKPVDGNGNPAKTFSLMDVITCGQPSGAPGATVGSSPTLGTNRSLPPNAAPNPVGQLAPIPIPDTIPAIGGVLGEIGNAIPKPGAVNGPSWLDNLARGIHDTLDGLPIIGSLLRGLPL